MSNKRHPRPVLFLSKKFLGKVQAKVDIVAIIRKYLGGDALKKDGGNYVTLCPFHSEKTASFKISTTKQRYRCFGCGAEGDVFDFVAEYDGISREDALLRLAATVDIKSGPSNHTHSRRRNRAVVRKRKALIRNLEQRERMHANIRAKRKKGYVHLCDDIPF